MKLLLFYLYGKTYCHVYRIRHKERNSNKGKIVENVTFVTFCINYPISYKNRIFGLIKTITI